MKQIMPSFENWPRNKDGEPTFGSTEEAHFYANLIFNDDKRTKRIRKAMENTRQQVNELREAGNKCFNLIFPLVCKAQFYRECLEELDRIHNDQFFT